MSKILVVDDSKYICDAIKLILVAKGFETDIAYDGESALKKIKAKDFDLVILDLMMPGMSGIDVYKELKNNTSKIKVIVLTAKTDALEKEPELKGIDAFMPKPFDKEELVKNVTKLLG